MTDDSMDAQAEGTKRLAFVSRLLDKFASFAQRGVIRSIGVLVGGAVIIAGVARVVSGERFTGRDST